MSVSLIASEGGAGYYPENTAYAVRQSLAQGVVGCELDFHLTADGYFVTHHDYLLNPALTRDNSGAWLTAPGPAINQSTLDELRKFDFGSHDPTSNVARRYPHRTSIAKEPIATFEDIEAAFVACEDPASQLWFEAKTDPFNQRHTTPAQACVAALTKLLTPSPLLSRTVLIAFDWDVLEQAQRQMSGLQTGYLTIDLSWLARGTSETSKNQDGARWFGNFNPANYANSIPRAVHAAGGTYWSPYFRDLTTAAVAEAHDLGIKVSTWGADKTAEISEAVATGIDSATTAYVDRATRVLAARSGA